MQNKALKNTAQQYAEMLFMQEFDKHMKNKNLEAFKKDYRTLYSKVIIPIISSEFIDSTKSREHEANWEMLMMELVGEDGPGSVRTAIEQLKIERSAYLSEVKQLRKTVTELQDALETISQFLLRQRASIEGAEAYHTVSQALRKSRNQ